MGKMDASPLSRTKAKTHGITASKLFKYAFPAGVKLEERRKDHGSQLCYGGVGTVQGGF